MIAILAYYYTTINWIGWVVLKMHINHNPFGVYEYSFGLTRIILYYIIRYTRKCAFFRIALYINQPGWKPSKKVDQLDRKRTQRSVWITLRVSKFYVILFIYFIFFTTPSALLPIGYREIYIYA